MNELQRMDWELIHKMMDEYEETSYTMDMETVFRYGLVPSYIPCFFDLANAFPDTDFIQMFNTVYQIVQQHSLHIRGPETHFFIPVVEVW